MLNFGFVIPDNIEDTVPIDLEVPEDELYGLRMEAIQERQLTLEHALSAKRLPQKLLDTLRIIVMDGEQLVAFNANQTISNASELEKNMLLTLKQMLEDLLGSFGCSIEEDDALLRSLATLKNYNAYSAITYRKGQKAIIKQSLLFTDQLLSQLS
eukprot:TRINITY_DN3597_c0_g2_i1.p1 TRINITY_DN3597_c0_g2~~TRINITY_DN3597_c0_g2_i1.p1  ORF type:complete len:155 (-),score=50.81 TRINITY_DN3597_c0_g2_i1:683-1147(-)